MSEAQGVTSARLTDSDIAAFRPEAKIGILATRTPEGLPHLSLITSIRAKTSTQLIWGQFCEGVSKQNVERDPRVGFVVMNADREFWHGAARWTHKRQEGEDYVDYNQTTMFRYNSYIGIHTVHYMDLVECAGRRKLSTPGIVAGSLLAKAGGRIGSALNREKPGSRVLKSWAESHVADLETLKFLSWIGDDGYPVVVPVVPASPASSGRLVLARTVFSDELKQIHRGARLALFALSLGMESVLTRGTFRGWRGLGPLAVGSLDIDWVYNSMPPKQGQIYPLPGLEPVRAF